MVTMVYPDTTPIGYRQYVGARAFRSWENAIAYALLPAAPGFGIAPSVRRQVVKGASGRWVVGPTSRPRRVRPGMVSW